MKNIKNEEFELTVNHLNYEQQVEIDGLIQKFKSVFAKDKYDIGTVQG